MRFIWKTDILDRISPYLLNILHFCNYVCDAFEIVFIIILFSGQPIIVYRSDKAKTSDTDETFTGSLNNLDETHTWVQTKCVPLVREITFENAEELTEEGLPFLILFHTPGDTEIVKKYNDLVIRELLGEKRV